MADVYPENRAEFQETVRAPRHPPPSLLLVTTAIFCLHRIHRATHHRSIARSFVRSVVCSFARPLARPLARADYNDRLQRCRRSSWTAAAARTRTRPGTKRQRDPPGGTRTRPRAKAHRRLDRSTTQCHRCRASVARDVVR